MLPEGQQPEPHVAYRDAAHPAGHEVTGLPNAHAHLHRLPE